VSSMISSIVLAAGVSSRMGRPKALLDWGGKPLAVYQVEQLREAGATEVIVVLGHRTDEIRRILRRSDCRVMSNPAYHAGRAGSLRLGAKAVNRDADAILVVNVDQPRPASFYRDLIAAHRPESAATRPEFDGRHGHPVIVAGRLRSEMMAATEEQQGLAGVLRKHSAELASFPSTDLCLLDINTPEDYARAVERFGLKV
jgi:molybdenum cofactor cytidylyltransferase